MPRGMSHGIPFKKIGKNPNERLEVLRYLLKALIKHERIETSFNKSSELQKYAVRLIDIAKYGKENTYCRDMVEFWSGGEEEIKDKLFNVLVPRYQEHTGKYTRIAILPEWYDKHLDRFTRMSVLELKGNPLPPLPVKEDSPYTLQNVLISAAKEDWLKSKHSSQNTDSTTEN